MRTWPTCPASMSGQHEQVPAMVQRREQVSKSFLSRNTLSRAQAEGSRGRQTQPVPQASACKPQADIIILLLDLAFVFHFYWVAQRKLVESHSTRRRELITGLD